MLRLYRRSLKTFRITAIWLLCYIVYSNREITIIVKNLAKNSNQNRFSCLNFRGQWIKTDLPSVVDVVKNFTIVPSNEQYNLTVGNSYSALEYLLTQKREPWVDVAIIMETLLPKGQQRYFLECGANEGEIGSNTLYLEKYRNWKGLLIEPDPVYFAQLKSKKRKAVAVEVCASPEKNVSVMTLHHPPPTFQLISEEFNINITAGNPGRGHLVGFKNTTDDDLHKWTYIDVLCVPIYSIMLATNMVKFDFVVLDAEGSEYYILKTIPFDKVEMKFILVELLSEESKRKITSLLQENKYILHALYEGNTHPVNGLFVKGDLYDKKKLKKRHSLKELYQIFIGDKDINTVTRSELIDLYSALELTSEILDDSHGHN